MVSVKSYPHISSVGQEIKPSEAIASLKASHKNANNALCIYSNHMNNNVDFPFTPNMLVSASANSPTTRSLQNSLKELNHSLEVKKDIILSYWGIS